MSHKVEKIGNRAKVKSTSEIPILYGKLFKARKSLVRNTKRLLKLKSSERNSPLGQSLNRYFMEYDRMEQRLISLGEYLEYTLRENPELIGLLISKFEQVEIIANESL